MAISTIGILSPGDMGHGVGQVLREHGARVMTSLEGRSERTRGLTVEAGIEDAGNLDNLVMECDLILSILVPSAAVPIAHQVAAALQRTGKVLLYADCNAIAPNTAKEVASIITAAGSRFADAGIFGPPPTEPDNRFAVSGPGAAELAEALTRFGLEVRTLDGDVGQASGLKMCYAAYTKGSTALVTQLLVTAERLGLTDTLLDMPGSIGADVKKYSRGLPVMPTKAHRWVPEMLEIAKTLADAGVPSKSYEGVSELYGWVATTEAGHETPENRDTTRDLRRLVTELAEGLEGRVAAR